MSPLLDSPRSTIVFETDAIHQGQGYKDETGAVIPPAYLTSTFAYGNVGGFDYTRSVGRA